MEAILNWIVAFGTLLSGFASLFTIYAVYSIHKREKLLTQRQLLLPLWDHLTSLNGINPKDPITVDVIKSLNTLELVAVCSEGGMIDPNVIKRVFGDVFLKQYMDIERCDHIEGLGKTGRELLMENPATMSFYDTLMKEHKEHGKLSTE